MADDSRQRVLFPRADVYRIADRLASLPGVVLACSGCQHVYEPTSDDWERCDTGCPRCGGWTFIASMPEPREAGSP